MATPTTRPGPRALVVALLLAVVGPWLLLAAPAGASTRGQGTMLVKDTADCSGTGTTSTVTLPFSLLFTGFDPYDTGTVSAYTQPGGELIASTTVTVDADGYRCVRVTGTAPPGQYKIAYDVGDGGAKQKVIRLEGPAVTATPTSTPTTTTTPSPSLPPTVTATPSTSLSSSASGSTSGTPSGSTSGSASGTPSGSSSVTSSTTPTPSGSSATATPAPTPTPEASTAGPGDLVLTPTGPTPSLTQTGSASPQLLLGAAVLLVVGVALVAGTRRRPEGEGGAD